MNLIKKHREVEYWSWKRFKYSLIIAIIITIIFIGVADFYRSNHPSGSREIDGMYFYQPEENLWPLSTAINIIEEIEYAVSDYIRVDRGTAQILQLSWALFVFIPLMVFFSLFVSLLPFFILSYITLTIISYIFNSGHFSRQNAIIFTILVLLIIISLFTLSIVFYDYQREKQKLEKEKDLEEAWKEFEVWMNSHELELDTR